MKNIFEAEEVLQRAYNIDLGTDQGSIEPQAVLIEIGPALLHDCYYVSGLAQQEEIRKHLQDFPEGQLARLIGTLRDALSEIHPKEMLHQWYGLPETNTTG